jgi:hypothetical protein
MNLLPLLIGAGALLLWQSKAKKGPRAGLPGNYNPIENASDLVSVSEGFQILIAEGRKTRGVVIVGSDDPGAVVTQAGVHPSLEFLWAPPDVVAEVFPGEAFVSIPASGPGAASPEGHDTLGQAIERAAA